MNSLQKIPEKGFQRARRGSEAKGSTLYGGNKSAEGVGRWRGREAGREITSMQTATSTQTPTVNFPAQAGLLTVVAQKQLIGVVSQFQS